MADNQDEMMTQFIEKITPKLTDAVMGKVNETLAQAEKAIGDRMDGLADKNAELLGKLHKAKGTDDPKKIIKEVVAAAADKFAVQKPKEIVLSKAEARDPRAYRAAKAEAAEAGVPLRIDREAS